MLSTLTTGKVNEMKCLKSNRAHLIRIVQVSPAILLMPGFYNYPYFLPNCILIQ